MHYEMSVFQGPTIVTIGVDIKDIPKVSDQDFSITLNAYFNVKWRDPRLLVTRESRHHQVDMICMLKIDSLYLHH